MRILLAIIPLLLLVTAACGHPRPIDPVFPWPSSGVAEADSLTLALERNGACGESYADYVRLLDSLHGIVRLYPHEKLVALRYRYFLAWHLNAYGRLDECRALYDSAVAEIDSAAHTYDLFKWHQLYAHFTHDRFESYNRSIANYAYFDKVGDEFERSRSAILLGNMHKSLRDTAKAAHYYNEALEIADRYGFDNISWATRINLSHYMDSTGCDSLLRDLLGKPMVTSAPLRRVLTLLAIFDNSGNIDALDEAIRLHADVDPENSLLPDLYLKKGEALLMTGCPEAATTCFKLADKELSKGYQGADSAIIRFRRAEAYEYEGKIDSAFAYMSRAFKELNSTINDMHVPEVYGLETKARIDLMTRNSELARTRTLALATLLVFVIVAVAVVLVLHYRRRAIEKKLRSDLYEEQLRHSRETTALRQMVIGDKNALIAEIESVVDAARKPGLNDNPVIADISRALQAHKGLEADRESMVSVKEDIGPEIAASLRRDFPTLTKGQLKMTSMIIIGADNRQIARALNISAESVWKGRYRLRSRLGLDSDTRLEDFLRDYADTHRHTL